MLIQRVACYCTMIRDLSIMFSFTWENWPLTYSHIFISHIIHLQTVLSISGVLDYTTHGLLARNHHGFLMQKYWSMILRRAKKLTSFTTNSFVPFIIAHQSMALHPRNVGEQMHLAPTLHGRNFTLSAAIWMRINHILQVLNGLYLHDRVEWPKMLSSLKLIG